MAYFEVVVLIFPSYGYVPYVALTAAEMISVVTVCVPAAECIRVQANTSLHLNREVHNENHALLTFRLPDAEQYKLPGQLNNLAPVGWRVCVLSDLEILALETGADGHVR